MCLWSMRNTLCRRSRSSNKSAGRSELFCRGVGKDPHTLLVTLMFCFGLLARISQNTHTKELKITLTTTQTTTKR